MTGREILKNCERYFLENMPYSTETVISLEDAEEAIDNFLKNNIK
jgi:hypothetical protein